jgi:hypothetical protein
VKRCFAPLIPNINERFAPTALEEGFQRWCRIGYCRLVKSGETPEIDGREVAARVGQQKTEDGHLGEVCRPMQSTVAFRVCSRQQRAVGTTVGKGSLNFGNIACLHPPTEIIHLCRIDLTAGACRGLGFHNCRGRGGRGCCPSPDMIGDIGLMR